MTALWAVWAPAPYRVRGWLCARDSEGWRADLRQDGVSLEEAGEVDADGDEEDQ